MARHRRLVLVLWLLVLVLAASLYPVLQRRLGVPDYSVGGSESARAEASIAEHFPERGAEQDVLVFRSDRYVADAPEYERVVTVVTRAVENDPDVIAVVSPYSTVDGSQISADRHVAVALVSMRGDGAARGVLAEEVRKRVGEVTAGGPVEAYLTGSSPLNNDLSAVELRDQEVAESIGVPVALLVLIIALGSLMAAALPIVIALASVLTCLGVLAALAIPLHFDRFVTVITTMIGIGVGIDYALFVVSRFREELRERAVAPTRSAGRATIDRAVAVALHTSGRTIAASGLIVMVALGSLMLISGHIFVEIAVASGIVVMCCLAAGLTLLPALLAVLGERVNWGRLPRRTAVSGDRAATGRWAGWARVVLRRPLLLGLPALAVLCVFAGPAVALKLGFDLGLGSLRDTPSGRGQQIVATAFQPGSVGPVALIGCAERAPLTTSDLNALGRLTASLHADGRIARVVSVTDLLDHTVGGHSAADLAQASASPELRPALSQVLDNTGRCAYIEAVPAVPVDSAAAAGLIGDLRTRLIPATVAGTFPRIEVGGLTARYADLSTETTKKLPLVVLVVLGLSFCYLLVVFRSVLLPAVAVLLNLVATAAALGLTVFVFQMGHGAHVFGFTSVGTLQAYLPVALFALLFGLSMDYEVFLVRRIQEEWSRGHDNALSVTTALDRTARQITAGAAIMVAVFGSFLVADVLELKQFGFGLAVAVLIDATIVRMLLVPAAMGIGGRANWWLPRVLARALPSPPEE